MKFKRKKLQRYRGSHTHGCGSMKKRRGAGNRGGRGRAGSGKKADQKKPSYWKNKYFGIKSFSNPGKKNIKAINLSLLDRSIHNYVVQGKAKKEGESFVINLKDLGFDKLLGTGFTQKRFRISAEYASKKAIEKIHELKGEITGLKPKKVKKHKAKAKPKKEEDVEETPENKQKNKKEEAKKEVKEHKSKPYSAEKQKVDKEAKTEQ